MGALQQEKAKVIELIEQLDAEQLEALQAVLAERIREAENPEPAGQESREREYVPCPMANCNMWMRKGRKPTVHYRAAHPDVKVPETV